MKKIIFFIILIGSLFIIYNFSLSIYSLWKKQDLLYKAENSLEQARKENARLKKQLQTAQTPSYIEEQVRTKLFLAKTSEKEIFIPQAAQAQAAQRAQDMLPVWKQWLLVFWY